MPAEPCAIRNAVAAWDRGLSSENVRRSARGVVGVHRARVAVCCLLATVVGLAGAARGAVFPDAAGGGFSGQPGGAGAGAAVRAESSAPPDVTAALRVYGIVEGYVRGTGGLEALREGEPAASVHGCMVVLRLGGEVVGRGSAVGTPGSAASAARVAEAVEGAWGDVERRVPPGATEEARAARAERMKRMRGEVLISLELSGPMIRFGAAGYNDLDLTLQPGMDGLAAAMEGKVHAVFPSAAVEGNVTPGNSARRAVAAIATAVRGEGGSTVSLTEPGELEKKHGVTLYRFRTTHVAQWRSDKGPELLYRGQKLVLQQDVDEVAELWHIADRLAGNLVNRLTLTPAGGNASLTSGKVDESDAFGLALARHALLEYWDSRTDGGKIRHAPDDAAGVLVERVVAAAQSYLPTARERAKQTDDKDRLAASAVIARNKDAKSAPEVPVIKGSFDGEGLLNADVPAGLRGLVIWGDGDPFQAVSARDGKPRDPWSSHPSEPAVRKLMAETPVGGLVVEMPWLGWIDLSIDEHLKRPRGSKSASALREMRTLIWKHQLQAVDAGPDRQDMVGGIVPPPLPGSASPLPTWQTARLVAFLGTMLGEPELTTKTERGGEIVKLLSAARFLRQLQVDDAMGWVSEDPAVVKGGLRNATWDQRTQTDATAMALLAVLEIIGGVEKAAANGQSAK